MDLKVFVLGIWYSYYYIYAYIPHSHRGTLVPLQSTPLFTDFLLNVIQGQTLMGCLWGSHMIPFSTFVTLYSLPPICPGLFLLLELGVCCAPTWDALPFLQGIMGGFLCVQCICFTVRPLLSSRRGRPWVRGWGAEYSSFQEPCPGCALINIYFIGVGMQILLHRWHNSEFLFAFYNVEQF